jgi:argininosuccinate lyase
MKSEVSGLLSDSLDPLIQELIYGASLEEDFRDVFESMTDVNLAHVVMLSEQGIVEVDTARQLLIALEEMRAAGPSAFNLDPSREETYFNYEANMIDAVGPEIGGVMHVARSRNDLKVATDRMRSRDACLDILEKLAEVRESALARAEEFSNVVMPGYTHMQPAQPTTFGYFILGFAKALERDYQRFSDAYNRINLNPLGSCAFAGTSFPVDRERTRELLGFEELVEHNQDAVASRDFALELLSACAQLGLTWSRFVQDLYLMSTYEFRTVRFPDSVFGTSSIMPQKKNPIVLEHLRGRASRLVGTLNSMMVATKGTNFTISIDAVSDALKGYYDALNDTSDGLKLLELVIRTVEPDPERMIDMVRRNFATVTDLADALVRESGLSFREAHHLIGASVRMALERGMTADQMSPKLLSQAANEVLGRDLSLSSDVVSNGLDPAAVVSARDGIGGPAPAEVLRMVSSAKQKLVADRDQTTTCRDRLEEARQTLNSAVQALVRQ